MQASGGYFSAGKWMLYDSVLLDIYTSWLKEVSHMPEISVIIPLYNKAPHIARAIDSVLSQTVQNFEILVIDDGSTDNGGQIVASYADSRIRLTRQENQGVSAARNRGIFEAQADFLAFLDADDEWGKDHLEVLFRLRRNFPEAGAYSTAYIHVCPGDKRIPVKIKKIPSAPWEGLLPDYFLSASFGEPPVWSSAVAIPHTIFHNVGLFKASEKLGEDLDMWGRIALRYPIAFSWRGVAFFREDATERACVINHIENELPFVRFVKEHFKTKEIPASVQIYVGELQHPFIGSLVIQGRKREALRILLSINFSYCRKYNYFCSLARILLPRPLTRAIGASKRRLVKILASLCLSSNEPKVL